MSDDSPFRCFGGDDEMDRYHDTEWGVPVRDERGLFERLVLEAFQSGLSWRTILRKREGFRRAFAGFDWAEVALFDEGDVARLLADADIVRNRAKIEAAIANARAIEQLHHDGESLADIIWSHAPTRPAAAWPSPGDVPSKTPESAALAKRLKKLGFAFIGPTTAYATMQACGVVNDHLAGCPYAIGGDQERTPSDLQTRPEKAVTSPRARSTVGGTQERR